jgi:biopolymer transport protein ExbD
MASKLKLLKTRRAGMQPNADPNVIPFIDILLVLVIIFMVAAPVPTVDIKVDLPPPNAIPTISENHPTIVSLVDYGGGYSLFVDGAPIAGLEYLGSETLKRALVNNPGRPVEQIYAEARIYLKADQNTIYKNVMDVMNALQDEGFVKVGVVAEEAQS